MDKAEAFKKSLSKSFVHFIGEGLALYGSMSFNQQNINDKGIIAPINYVYDAVNSRILKPAYTGVFRVYGIYKEKHRYTFTGSLIGNSNIANKLTATSLLMFAIVGPPQFYQLF